MTEIEAEVGGSQVREIDRIGAFTDGVMAIAITLLVLNIQVPDVPPGDTAQLRHELLALWPHIFAYGLSFAVIGRYWVLHHRFIAMLRGYDLWLVTINLVFLAFIVLIPFAADLIGKYGGDAEADITYAIILTAAAAANLVGVRYALRRGYVIPARTGETPLAGWRGYMVVGIFAASIPIALLSARAAQLCWLLVVLIRPRVYKRGG